MLASIDRLNPTTLPDASKVGYSQISIVQPTPLAFVSGQVAWQVDGADTPTSLDEQIKIVTTNLKTTLNTLSASPHDIVQMRIYMTDVKPQAQEITMAEITRFLEGAQPSLTGIGVVALAAPDLKIEVEMVVQVVS